MTASRALRGMSNVLPETRARVMMAAAEIGYEADPVVAKVMSKLGRSRSQSFYGTVAWMNAFSEEHAWRRRPGLQLIRRSAEAACQRLNFALDEVWIGNPEMKPSAWRKILDARGIVGAILTGGDHSLTHFNIDVSGWACVSIGMQIVRPQLHRVTTNTFDNVTLALRMLKRSGYRRIGLQIPDWVNRSGRGRLSGAFLHFQESLPVRGRVPILLSGLSHSRDIASLRKWIERYRPDCIVCVSGQMVDILGRIGYSVPEDLGVAHMNLGDDVQDWSGIDTRPSLLASTAVERVVDLYQRQELGLPDVPQDLLITGTWRAGRTTRLLRAATEGDGEAAD